MLASSALDSESSALIDATDSNEGQEQEQAQVQVQKPKGPSQSEIEFQEALIAEREADIEEIETGIHELNEIFRDLGHIVQEQGGMIGACPSSRDYEGSRWKLTEARFSLSRQHRVQRHIHRDQYARRRPGARVSTRIPAKSRTEGSVSVAHCWGGHSDRLTRGTWMLELQIQGLRLILNCLSFRPPFSFSVDYGVAYDAAFHDI